MEARAQRAATRKARRTASRSAAAAMCGMDWLRKNLLTRRVVRFGRLGWQAWLQFAKDYCLLLAAALSFYALVSLIPLCFLALWALSHWFGPEAAYRMVVQLVRQEIPQAAEVIIGQVDVIRQGSARWMTGSLWGLLLLVWAGAGFCETLERILTAAWAGRPLRGYLQRKWITFLTFLCAAVFFGASMLATAALTTIARLDIRVVGLSPRDFPWLWNILAALLPFVLSVIMFFLLYKFLPNASVPTGLALKAAACAGVAWEFSKILFARFIARHQTYEHLYGSLTGVVVFMLWIYLSAVILLMGAELAAAYHFDAGGPSMPEHRRTAA